MGISRRGASPCRRYRPLSEIDEASCLWLSPVQVLSRNGSIGYGQFGRAAVAPRQDVGGAWSAVAEGGIFAQAARVADEVLGAGGTQSKKAAGEAASISKVTIAHDPERCC